MSHRSLAAAIIVLSTAFTVILFAAWFAAFDDGGIRRGDLAYFLFIPSRVRALPTPGACDAPTFASRTNDSLEAETIGMEFHSRAESEAVRATYAREFERWHCSSAATLSPQAPAPATLRCTSPKVDVTMDIGAAADELGCRRVLLEFRF